MVHIWKRCKVLQLFSTINNDHLMFIWRCNPVSSFSKTLPRYQNCEILWCLNVIALSNSYMYIKFAFRLNCWLFSLLRCMTYNIECPITFPILEKWGKEKLKILMWYTCKNILTGISNAPKVS